MTGPPQASAPKLYLNHDVSRAAAVALRREGFDVIAAEEVEMAIASDEEQLARATTDGRALVSFNVRDYPALHFKFLRQNRSHCGIVLSPQRRVRETIRALRRLLTTTTATELQNQLRWL